MTLILLPLAAFFWCFTLSVPDSSNKNTRHAPIASQPHWPYFISLYYHLALTFIHFQISFSTKHPINPLEYYWDSPHSTMLFLYKSPSNLQYFLSWKSHSILPIPSFTSFITLSIYTLKILGNMIHLCLTPLLVLKTYSHPLMILYRLNY